MLLQTLNAWQSPMKCWGLPWKWHMTWYFSKSIKTSTPSFIPRILIMNIPPCFGSIPKQNCGPFFLILLKYFPKIFPTQVVNFVPNALNSIGNIFNVHQIGIFNSCESSRLNNDIHSWYIAIHHKVSCGVNIHTHRTWCINFLVLSIVVKLNNINQFFNMHAKKNSFGFHHCIQQHNLVIYLVHKNFGANQTSNYCMSRVVINFLLKHIHHQLLFWHLL